MKNFRPLLPGFVRATDHDRCELKRTPKGRRAFLKMSAAATALLPFPALAQGMGPRILVLGGGFAGVSCARAIRDLDPRMPVTLIELNRTFIACPFSNSVIAGLRAFEAQQFNYDKLGRYGIDVAPEEAIAVDIAKRTVTISGGTVLAYDRLVLAPGIDFRWDALPGYSEAASELMPHAWKAGQQTRLLRKQLESMDDGGLVVISAPANPYRCPPGPYERASLLAYYLKNHKPRAKLIILDAKDQFPKQRLFQTAWKELYRDILEWVPLSNGGKLVSVDPSSNTLTTDFSEFKANVANVIPPQSAGRIAQHAGVADQTGWCPVDPITFESRLAPNVHVIGDAAMTGAMPKSAFAANAQAKVCAAAIVALALGQRPTEPKLINTCYSLIEPDYAISTVGVYRPANGQLVELQGSGGASPLEAPASLRQREAALASAWFRTITTEAFE